jgi:hypothetical protein
MGSAMIATSPLRPHSITKGDCSTASETRAQKNVWKVESLKEKHHNDYGDEKRG